jgi:putative selenium metabolism hydrolase
MNELGYDEVLIDEYGSVLGIINGSLPGPTLLFDGHMDVVPVREPEAWEHEPYGSEISEGRMWGRGTTDMKGALAAMICAASYLNRAEIQGRILVSASVAEELLIGTALDLILNKFSVDAVVIPEPTSLKLGYAEKGRASIEMICQGTVAHSSRPDLGDNAVYRMMEAVKRIRALSRRTHPVLGSEVIELVEISSLPTPGNGSIPGTCRALWECRLLPGETKEGFLERWKAAIEAVGRTEIRIADYKLNSYTGQTMKMDDFLPGWMTQDVDKGFTALVSESIKEGGRTLEYYAAPYGCNALVSAAKKNIPTVILGPGDISLAHKPNENILIEDLLAAADIYQRICGKMSAIQYTA